MSMGWLDNCKPIMIMCGLQFIYAGFILFTTEAFTLGMSPRIFVVYRQVSATVTMLPIAFFSRREASSETSVGVIGFAYIFAAALFGLTGNQNLYFEGVKLSSSTIGGAMVNLIPAVTFAMATALGLEKVSIKSVRSIAKIIGTIICVSGAVVIATLKGPVLLEASLGAENFLTGSIFCFAGSCCWSIWLILQVQIAKYCPDNILSTTWMCFFATLQAAIVALLVDRNLDIWILHSTFEIVGCICCGVASAVSVIGQAWCISRRGPVFSAMFNPLTTAIVVVVAAIFLREKIYTASLLGAIVMIAGLYIVLWGKAKDLEEKQELDQIDETTMVDDSSEKAISKVDLEEPLLSNNTSTSA